MSARILPPRSRYITVKLTPETLAALDARVADTLASGRAEVARDLIASGLKRSARRAR